MPLPAFTLHRPRSAADAIALLDEDCLAYSGGTELLMAMRMGLIRPTALVDLKRIDELNTITLGADRLLIGAGASHDRVAGDALVAEHAALLATAERLVGNARVRAQGSIGGNICFAEPRSDVATVLVALDATVLLQSASSRRSVPATEFFLGPYWTAREPGELLTAISIPLPAPAGVYLKFQTVERPTVAVAAVALPEGGYRIVVGAVGDLPVSADYAQLTAVDAADLAARVEPVSDLTGSERYKRHVTEVFVRRAVAALAGGR
ncbi:MAG: aerobic carbon-monoxide dehydrogenase medium subunit [Pseudonocardiales bacterium]|jgi:carbon-monoxide dehydrogenase medium subunit|nr:Molybdopterin dehydrogenase, FAD-binding [Pseudonocardiales bacterium]MDT4975877.1 aerobic carbon-monoxide dehydrogenase medium subunit [Pseudonocardiales bacterium]